MSTIRFEPLAAQLAKQVPLAALFPPNVVEETRREQRKNQSEEDPPPEDVQTFMAEYMTVAGAACSLLNHPAFERLSRMMQAFEDEYMPGGPPMSPVYHSYSVQHMLAEVPTGMADETPYSVLAKVTTGSQTYARLHAMAQALADAHCDLYRVRAVQELDSELIPIRGGESFSVRTTGPFLRTGDFVLARVVNVDGRHFIADSPYLLRASEQEWLEYLERAVKAQQPKTEAVRRQPAGNLSPKQVAKWRKQQRANAQASDNEQLIVRHLKHGLSERFWLDFVMDAYAGERNGIVFLAGVPDRPETLPHSKQYKPEQGSGASLHQLRHDLQEASAREGTLERAVRLLHATMAEAGIEQGPLNPNELQLFTGYVMFSALSVKGQTALETVAPRWQDTPERRALWERLREAGFCVLRTERIHLDKGLDVLELRSKKKHFITEKSLTRQIAQGDLLLGWIYEEDGTLRFEGHIQHVPGVFAEATAELVRLFEAGQRSSKAKDFRTPAGALPIHLLVGLRKLHESFVNPSLDTMEPELAQTLKQARSARPLPNLANLPPEVLEHLQRRVIDQLRQTVDTPIPQLQGKTLRQVARSKKSRPDAISWLREQERLLRDNPQLRGVDLRPIWQDLGLEYQGLETDP